MKADETEQDLWYEVFDFWRKYRKKKSTSFSIILAIMDRFTISRKSEPNP